MTFESIYSWFYSSEDAVSDLSAVISDILQLLEKLIDFLSVSEFNQNHKALPTDEEFKKQIYDLINEEL